MSALSEILAHNRQFVADGQYCPFFTDKIPNRHLAILSCMDTRMTELLPQALGLKNGDVKLIKNAGATVNHLWGSVMRSMLIAVYELKVKEIMVVAHRDCGVQGLNSGSLLQRALDAGISQERIDLLRDAGIDLDGWLRGFDRVEDNVHHAVSMICKHPLMPSHVLIHGLVIHPTTGQLEVLIEGQSSRPPSAL